MEKIRATQKIDGVMTINTIATIHIFRVAVKKKTQKSTVELK